MSIAHNKMEVRVNLAAIRSNYRLLAGHGGRVIGVVKADAYGHGLCEVAGPYSQEGCDTFAIGSVRRGPPCAVFCARRGSRPASCPCSVPWTARTTPALGA
jgi:alanine racemase